MTNQQQKIEVIRQMLQEKVRERDLLKDKLEAIQIEIKQIDISINAFQNELEKFTGDKVIVRQVPLRGAEIRDAAIEALRRLGRKTHYIEVKEEIEKYQTINGVNEKSKADSVWNQLNKSEQADKLGCGEFQFKTEK
jgi:hypothetical protein